jgi:hypothetical protein
VPRGGRLSKAEDRETAVLGHLRAHPDAWISAPGVNRALGRNPFSVHKVRQSLAVLRDRGLVVSRPAQQDGGTEWKIVSSQVA